MSLPHPSLKEKAAELRTEALHLLKTLGVLEAIRGTGCPAAIVGSVDLDLMVWPDIDVYTRLQPEGAGRLLAMLPILHHRAEENGYAVVRVNFNDEYRRPGNPYGKGLYIGCKILSPDRKRLWKLDLWAWDETTFLQKLAEHRHLGEDLASTDRDLTLRIKETVHSRPEYRDTLTSMDVYDFVISGRGQSIEQFDEFVAQRMANRRSP